MKRSNIFDCIYLVFMFMIISIPIILIVRLKALTVYHYMFLGALTLTPIATLVYQISLYWNAWILRRHLRKTKLKYRKE